MLSPFPEMFERNRHYVNNFSLDILYMKKLESHLIEYERMAGIL